MIHVENVCNVQNNSILFCFKIQYMCFFPLVSKDTFA